MAIFRRRSRSRHSADDATAVDDAARDATTVDEAAAHSDPERDPLQAQGRAVGEPDEQPDSPPGFERNEGPFDVDEPVPEVNRLDLGSLRVPAAEGLQLQFEVDQAADSVNSVLLSLGGSHVQLQAFAAPRTAGIWPQIRAEIAESISEQGGSAQVVDGPLGPELVAEMPRGGPALRFLGVDGPRWFLRAVLSGPAAADEAAAAPLLEVVKGVVVVRGNHAMAPRELLALSMPVVEPATEPLATEPDAAAPTAAGGDILNPFERGPEITEVR